MSGAQVWKLEGTSGERGGNVGPGPKGRHQGLSLLKQTPASSSETGSVERGDKPGVHWVEGRLWGVLIFSEKPKAWPGWESGRPTRREPVSTCLGWNRVEGTRGKCEHRMLTARNGRRIKMSLKPRKISSRKCPRRGPSSLTLAQNEAPLQPASCHPVRSATCRLLPGAPVLDLGLDESPARYFPLQAFGLLGPQSTQLQN